MLPPGGPSEEAKGKGWHRCRTCINYDECAACYEIKKEAGSPHPHDMWKYEYGWNWAKDEGQEGELQERILSFDGGGVRGYMTCLMFEQFAKRIAQERGMGEGQDLDKFVFSELLPCFKVIGGTSIGGLIAIGLSLGMLFPFFLLLLHSLCTLSSLLGVPLSKLIKTFKKDSKVIFKHEESSWLSGWIPEKLNPPVYNDEGLKHIFRSLVKIARPNLEEDEIENIRFEQLTCGWDTFVTAFDLYTNSPMVFSKRDHGSMKLLDAVLSTSAAPVYFPVHYFSRARELPKDKCKICVDGTQCKSEVCSSPPSSLLPPSSQSSLPFSF
jgi:patatin-like phospholipase/acyl hydrolase